MPLPIIPGRKPSLLNALFNRPQTQKELQEGISARKPKPINFGNRLMNPEEMIEPARKGVKERKSPLANLEEMQKMRKRREEIFAAFIADRLRKANNRKKPV